MRVRTGVLLLLLSLTPSLSIANDTPGADERLKTLESKLTDLESQLDQVRKSNDDVLFWLRLGDVAEIDKVSIVGPPNPRGKARYGIANERHPLRFAQYVFVPKRLDRSRKIVPPARAAAPKKGQPAISILETKKQGMAAERIRMSR